MSAIYPLKAVFVVMSLFVVTACQAQKQSVTPQEVFFKDISSHCGKAYAGKLVSTDEVDADFAAKAMVMHVRDCTDIAIRIPFHVEGDRSRTWVISKTDNGLRLKHDHRHEDGSEDAVTQYGGDTIYEGTASRQVFPVDQYSIDMFLEEGLKASIVNVWAVEINAAQFAYELRRPNRHFRVEFDIETPVEIPHAPWGSE